MSDATLRVLSLGAGVQSTAILLLACENSVMKFDAAIFADTGWEPKQVYDHLDRLEEVAKAAGIPVYRVSSGNIREDALDETKRFATMPLYVLGPEYEVTVVDDERPCHAPDCGWYEHAQAREDILLFDPDSDDLAERLARVPEPDRDCVACSNRGRIVLRSHVEKRRDPGMARRQCTSEYKLKPIKAKVRELLGYPHPTPVPRDVWVEQNIGISTDEIGRARDSDVGYMRNRFPLLDLGWSRKDCDRYLKANGWTSVAKSACIGCPFHGNRQWRALRDEHPEEWADAVAFDDAIRNGSARANAEGKELRGSMFLHRSRMPLDRAPIDRVTRREWTDRQGDLFDEIEDGDPDGCSPWTCRSGLPVEGETPTPGDE